MKVEVDEYMDIERRETVKAEARKLRRQFLRYKEAEIVYSIYKRYVIWHSSLFIGWSICNDILNSNFPN